jgi:hypothetical protein
MTKCSLEEVINICNEYTQKILDSLDEINRLQIQIDSGRRNDNFDAVGNILAMAIIEYHLRDFESRDCTRGMSITSFNAFLDNIKENYAINRQKRNEILLELTKR